MVASFLLIAQNRDLRIKISERGMAPVRCDPRGLEHTGGMESFGGMWAPIAIGDGFPAARSALRRDRYSPR
ncbi:hypothetical protein GCM10011588_11350 [Nocardia jinanensis]|uniref:Uncharacterized protein n=1 Tax=Nocardia jinanensis TaxID=382504 RepID=A0A917RAG8_9NOCA|nr:hypothetical protein GCM10011588_11350 [Nocardia jinanensis]